MKPHQKTRLTRLLTDREYRHAFFDGMVSTSIAAQIRANRIDRGWSQKRLGEEAGMKQSRISAMEDVTYQRWTIKTLKRLAEALDVTLSVRFESFGKALANFELFQERLVEPPYSRDPLIRLGFMTPDNLLLFSQGMSSMSNTDPVETADAGPRSTWPSMPTPLSTVNYGSIQA